MENRDMEKPKLSEATQIIVHQLKTPISAIKGYLEALLDGDQGRVNAGQAEYLKDALENIKRSSRFLDELFDVFKIEENKFDMKFKPVSLPKITKEVLREISCWFKAHNCKVIFEKPKKMSKVMADPQRIRQVVQNLIINAVIYKDGKGRVELKLEEKGKNVLFSCRDDGIGIPSSDFGKIFSKFYRSEAALSINPSGTGLGLFISKAIIELSGGKIWFESKEGKGTTFYFTLPIK